MTCRFRYTIRGGAKKTALPKNLGRWYTLLKRIRPKYRLIMIVCLTCMLVPPGLSARTVRLVLKNGTVLIGTVVRETASLLVIRNRYGTFPVNKAMIRGPAPVRRRRKQRKRPRQRTKKVPQVRRSTKPVQQDSRGWQIEASFAYPLTVGQFQSSLQGLPSAELRFGYRLPLLYLGGSLGWIRFADPQSSEDTLTALECSLEVRLIPLYGRVFSWYVGLQGGGAWMRADLPSRAASAAGWRPVLGASLGACFRLTPRWGLTVSAGGRIYFEQNNNLGAMPFSAGVRYAF